jgi:hypothetical protein
VARGDAVNLIPTRVSLPMGTVDVAYGVNVTPGHVRVPSAATLTSHAVVKCTPQASFSSMGPRCRHQAPARV